MLPYGVKLFLQCKFAPSSTGFMCLKSESAEMIQPRSLHLFQTQHKAYSAADRCLRLLALCTMRPDRAFRTFCNGHQIKQGPAGCIRSAGPAARQASRLPWSWNSALPSNLPPLHHSQIPAAQVSLHLQHHAFAADHVMQSPWLLMVAGCLLSRAMYLQQHLPLRPSALVTVQHR